MKSNPILTTASLLSIVLFICHLADDIFRGFEKGGLSNLTVVPILVLWLYATLVLSGRRVGQAIVFLFSFLASGIPVIHMMGRGVGVASRSATFSGHFFFVWTLLALGVTGAFSAVLAAQELWFRPRGEGR